MSTFDKNQPYNNLPLLPPSVDLESIGILKKTISASRALAELNGLMVNLPNPKLFLDTIHLQEAQASSEIENIITTNDELYKSIISEKKLQNSEIKEVLSYKEALWLGLEQLEKKSFITTNICIDIVRCIKKNTSGIRVTPGTKLSNMKGEVIYTPPSGEDVIREKLANLETFINSDHTLDPLVKLAIMHYQFEAIHPFSDGNGRTGRILLLLYLKMEGLLDVPAIYLSRYIIEHKSAYYEKLRGVTEKNDWESFVLYMLDMVEQTSKKSLLQLKQILNLMDELSDQIRAELPKVYSKDLIELLFKLPYTKRQSLVDAGHGNLKTSGSYLNSLEEKGFLKSFKMGKEKLYLNHALMKVLES